MNYLMVDGLRLAYQVDGDVAAPPLVFVNSLGTDLRMWDAQVAALRGKFRIVRYDTRGHGRSDVPTEPGTIARLGNDVVALLDALAIPRAHVCGLSLGGLTALWLAVHHPERLQRAVFAHTAARIGSVESWSTRIAAVQQGGMAAIRDAVVGRFLSPQFRSAQPDVTLAIGAMIEGIDPTGYNSACAALRDADLGPVVPSIHVPALIVAGRWDEATPLAQSEELQAAIAGSELVVLDAAHLGNVEQPEAFNTQLLRFLHNE